VKDCEYMDKNDDWLMWGDYNPTPFIC
jgi:hypothetical protein